MDTVETLAIKILADNGCDIYTYDGEARKDLVRDLIEAYPGGSISGYTYLEVANAILSITRPEPIVRKPYIVVYDTDNFCDSYGCGSLDEAKDFALEMLINWMAAERDEWKSKEPTEEECERFDYMIENCSVEVCEYNPATDEYDEVWNPSDEDLERIGWKEI